MRLLWFNLATDLDDPTLGFTSAWIASMARHVEHIDVITMRAGRTALPTNVRLYTLGKERGYGEPRRLWRFYSILWRLLRTHRPDGCFSHMAPVFSALAGPLLRAAGVPLVTWYAHPHLTRSLPLAHLFSRAMVTSLPTAYPYLRDRLVVLGQGIDTETFSPAASPLAVRARAEPPVLLSVGRLSPIKDHPTLLRALARLHQAGHRDLRVSLVGDFGWGRDAEYAAALEVQAKRLGVAEAVAFLGPRPTRDLPGFYRGATAHVNMTAIGSGDKTVLEAMACGIPSLAANAGFRATFGAYSTRLLYEHGNDGDLAEKLGQLLELNQPARDEMGAYLRERVDRLHGLDHLGPRLLGVFASRAPRELK